MKRRRRECEPQMDAYWRMGKASGCSVGLGVGGTARATRFLGMTAQCHVVTRDLGCCAALSDHVLERPGPSQTAQAHLQVRLPLQSAQRRRRVGGRRHSDVNT